MPVVSWRLGVFFFFVLLDGVLKGSSRSLAGWKLVSMGVPRSQ